jgi:hypothetical protein
MICYYVFISYSTKATALDSPIRALPRANGTEPREPLWRSARRFRRPTLISMVSGLTYGFGEAQNDDALSGQSCRNRAAFSGRTRGAATSLVLVPLPCLMKDPFQTAGYLGICRGCCLDTKLVVRYLADDDAHQAAVGTLADSRDDLLSTLRTIESDRVTLHAREVRIAALETQVDEHRRQLAALIERVVNLRQCHRSRRVAPQALGAGAADPRRARSGAGGYRAVPSATSPCAQCRAADSARVAADAGYRLCKRGSKLAGSI